MVNRLGIVKDWKMTQATRLKLFLLMEETTKGRFQREMIRLTFRKRGSCHLMKSLSLFQIVDPDMKVTGHRMPTIHKTLLPSNILSW